MKCVATYLKSLLQVTARSRKVRDNGLAIPLSLISQHQILGVDQPEGLAAC